MYDSRTISAVERFVQVGIMVFNRLPLDSRQCTNVLWVVDGSLQEGRSVLVCALRRHLNLHRKVVRGLDPVLGCLTCVSPGIFFVSISYRELQTVRNQFIYQTFSHSTCRSQYPRHRSRTREVDLNKPVLGDALGHLLPVLQPCDIALFNSSNQHTTSQDNLLSSLQFIFRVYSLEIRVSENEAHHLNKYN